MSIWKRLFPEFFSEEATRQRQLAFAKTRRYAEQVIWEYYLDELRRWREACQQRAEKYETARERNLHEELAKRIRRLSGFTGVGTSAMPDDTPPSWDNCIRAYEEALEQGETI